MNPKNALTIYYDPSSSLGKKTRATAQDLTTYLHVIDITTEKMTPTRWRHLLDALNLPPKKLLNKAHPTYQTLLKGSSYDDQGWLFILINHPELLRGPIVLKERRAILCEQPNDVYKLIHQQVA